MLNDPFQLFCLYYLGLNEQGEYRFVNANQICRNFNWSVGELMQALDRHKLHPDTVLNTNFPLARHQVDVQIAAESETGEQLKARASQIYEAFQRSLGQKRDWLKEIAEEQHTDSD